jgi:hypothetical protein
MPRRLVLHIQAIPNKTHIPKMPNNTDSKEMLMDLSIKISL